MQETYYTVEQISDMLHIHPKTIQRYIREGKLQASKVGKSWRISGHDVSAFMETNSPHAERSPEERAITTSSVIDISVNGTEDVIQIMNFLTAAMNAKPAEGSKSSMQFQHIERERIVRVMLWGDIRFLTAMSEMIAALTE